MVGEDMTPPKYSIQRISALKPVAEIKGHPTEVMVVEFEPTVDKKYLVVVEVGDLPVEEIAEYLKGIRKTCGDFFPDGTLYAPCRHGQPGIGIYELVEVPAKKQAKSRRKVR